MKTTRAIALITTILPPPIRVSAGALASADGRTFLGFCPNYINRMITILSLLLFMAITLSSCSDDDMACTTELTNCVRFRYVDRGSDRFDEMVNHVRYLLFDSEGKYLREMEPMGVNRSSVSLDRLGAGGYTLVCLCNLGDSYEIQGYVEGGIDSMRLVARDKGVAADGVMANGNRLYWGECSFDYTPGVDANIVADLSNIHSLLRIRVGWERLPEFSEGYSIRLVGVGKSVSLSSKGATVIGDRLYPEVTDYTGTISVDLSLEQLVLDVSLLTLRWSDENIPALQIFNGDSAVTKLIDLKPILERWGWSSGDNHSQEYEMRMTIRSDKSVVFKQGVETGSGWQDGGTIG